MVFLERPRCAGVEVAVETNHVGHGSHCVIQDDVHPALVYCVDGCSPLTDGTKMPVNERMILLAVSDAWKS